MNDLRNTKNHSLRRNLGFNHFSKHKEFFKATAKKSFHADLELLLRELIEKKLTVSLLPVNIGRKEFEEYICEKYDLLTKYNIRSRRK